MRSRRRTILKAAVLVLVLAPALGGCGRRGRLEPPPDPNAPAADKATVSKAGLHKRPSNPPIRAPDTPFILDPLLK